ncbi:hypothetical protein OSTOST_24972, partial [Ostertagia ostertagi]
LPQKYASEARRILEPLVLDYVRTFNAGDFDRMADFYHTNSVMVEKDKSVLYGKKDIVASLRQISTNLGVEEMEISNAKYDGVAEFPHIYTDFAFHTEKVRKYMHSIIQ